jgi:hypothetical protein
MKEKQMSGLPFNEKEISFIKENYGELTGAEIAKRIGRPKNSVYYQARKLGLHRTCTSEWPRNKIPIGKKVGKLTIIGAAEATRKGYKKWLCECDCGNKKAVLATHLKQGNTMSCGCISKESGQKHFNFKGVGEIHQNTFNKYKRSANLRGSKSYREKIEFSITIEFVWELFLKQNRKCALSGLPIEFGRRASDPSTASLDRIDSSKGYTENNVQWVHKDINYMKRTYNQDYFKSLCTAVANNNRIEL